MPSPFSRTLRSMNADSFYLSITGMLIAILLLSAWCIWFFTAKVAICKVSTKAFVDAGEKLTYEFPKGAFRVREIRQKDIVAEFPSEALSSIQPGQSAVFFPNRGIGKNTCPVPAVVSHVEKAQKDKGRIKLCTLSDSDNSADIKEGLKGKVQVEIGYVSPAVLLMQSSGLDSKPSSSPGSP